MRIHLNNLLNIPVKFIHLRIVKYLSSHSLPPSYPFRNFPARRMQASAAETEASRRRCRKTFEEAFPNLKSRGVLPSIRRCRRLRYVLVWTLFASRITSQTETHTWRNARLFCNSSKQPTPFQWSVVELRELRGGGSWKEASWPRFSSG